MTCVRMPHRKREWPPVLSDSWAYSNGVNRARHFTADGVGKVMCA
jgi:hypothetical protein